MANDLTVIILTFNEERHIARCIASVQGFAARVVVVDSFSTDRTRDLAIQFGAEVMTNSWKNHATQFNWALDNADIRTTWIMRLDADEVVLPDLADALSPPALAKWGRNICGLTVNRQIHFLGRWIRHGGIYPIPVLRVWRTGLGRCEDRWMDEHILVTGGVGGIAADIADINLNNLTWWTEKHNNYATREAIDVLLAREQRASSTSDLRMSAHTKLKRFAKKWVYGSLPSGLRPAVYFTYRFILRLGFLDGWPGLAFHVLQGFWYRFLVDAKLKEMERLMSDRQWDLSTLASREYGIDLSVRV